jgi:hypothetical protein
LVAQFLCEEQSPFQLNDGRAARAIFHLWQDRAHNADRKYRLPISCDLKSHTSNQAGMYTWNIGHERATPYEVFDSAAHTH